MTTIGITPELAGMFAACEDAYEQAMQEGYAENPAVIAAVTDLRSASTALGLASRDFSTAKGLFSIGFAAMRADRACRATRQACDKLHTAITQAAVEHRLYNRCLKLTSQHVA